MKLPRGAEPTRPARRGHAAQPHGSGAGRSSRPPRPLGPFARLDPARRSRLMARGLAGGAALGAVMVAVAKPMRDRGHDIIPLEVAGDAATVDRIVEDWGPEGVRAARIQTSLDMVFPAFYAVTTAAGCATVAAAARGDGHGATARLGAVLGWGSFAAAGFDLVENVSMLAELSGARGPLPRLARRCALAKFSLILPASAYAVAGLGAMGLSRARRRASGGGG